jgi:hypothetical protein
MTESATIDEHQTVDMADDQVGSQDEFEIALAEGVEDEALLEEAGVQKFSITSYGADYTVDSLVKRMKGGAFTIPKFQRRYVWSQKHASRFIESLLMGLPIPSIFLYKEAGTNKHLVIDGQQRLKTLQAYYDGLYEEKKFRLQGVREPWLGKTYAELDPSDQLKLDDSIVHATIFTQDKPEDALDSIYFVFERINSGGIRLSPQEIRDCVSAGPFIDLVKELNQNEDWRQVFGGPENKRAKDEELILRFFAMFKFGDTYSKPLAKFLNDVSDKLNKEPAEQLADLGNIFREAISLVNGSLNGRAFRPSKALNAAVFDSVLPAIAIRQQANRTPIDKDRFVAAYNALLNDGQYLAACERATSDDHTVATRRKLANQAFAAI